MTFLEYRKHLPSETQITAVYDTKGNRLDKYGKIPIQYLAKEVADFTVLKNPPRVSVKLRM